MAAQMLCGPRRREMSPHGAVLATQETERNEELDEWRRGMKEIAKRDNVLGVKFSGLVTEFNQDDWKEWDEAFERLMTPNKSLETRA